jgi:hypothetical protein
MQNKWLIKGLGKICLQNKKRKRMWLALSVNVLNLHRIDLARKYYTHLQREIEKEEEGERKNGRILINRNE